MKVRIKIIVILQTLIQIWVPVCLLYWSVARPLPAYADRFIDSARQGQTMGRGLVPDASSLGSKDENGNINLNWKGQTTTLSPSTLFQDEANTTDPHAEETYGNDAQVMDRAHGATGSMNSNSFTGQAYQTILGSANRGRVNMSNDPLWQQTDAAIERGLSGVDTNCEIITTSTTTTTPTHVPDYETCERVKYPGGDCKCRHDYTVTSAPYNVTVAATTNDGGQIAVNAQTGQILECSGSHVFVDCQLTSAPLPPNVCAAPGEGVVRTITSPHTNTYNAAIIQDPTCGNGLTGIFTVHNTAGSHAMERRSAGLVINIIHIIDHGWTCAPGCEVLLTNVGGDSIIRPESYTCTQGPCETSTMISGAQVDQGMLYSTNPFGSVGISNLAHEVTIALRDFNQGVMPCWTDPQGVVHCPANPGDRKDTCETLENNPNCSFIRQECIEGAEDPGSGVCYAWTVTYDCGVEVGVGDITTTMGYLCDGVIRCMGEECINGQFDLNNTGFARAAAMMQMLESAASDMDCTGGDCRIWTGDTMECKKALGGYVDCCTKPEGVSLVDYIKLLSSSKELASLKWDLTTLIPGPLGTNPLTGAYSTLSNYSSEVTNFLAQPFTSAWDSVVGNPGMLSGAESMTGASAPTAGLSQMLMRGANDFLTEFAPDLAASIFEEGGAMGTEIVFTATAELLMSAVSFIMWIYTIYQILDLLVHIIWACEKEEFELGAKRQLKVCHYVGSYCASDIVGICIEKKESYCCYNSPLARIMQEQIRMQGVDGGWGSGKHPRCEGLTPAQLAGVNWDAVDLSEWLALLAIGGQYPTQRDVSIDSLTGSGSALNFGNTSSPRPDAATRTLGKIDQSGEDLEQLRIQGGLSLWGQGPQH